MRLIFFLTGFLFIQQVRAGILKCELLENKLILASFSSPASLDAVPETKKFAKHLEGKDFTADVQWNISGADSHLTHKASGLSSEAYLGWHYDSPFEASSYLELGTANLNCKVTTEDGYSYPWKTYRELIDIRANFISGSMNDLIRLAHLTPKSADEAAQRNNAICYAAGLIGENELTQGLYLQLISLDDTVYSHQLFPDSYSFFINLQRAVMQLTNYCVPGIVQDPHPIGFQDTEGLIEHATVIQQQIVNIKSYLDHGFPNNGTFPGMTPLP